MSVGMHESAWNILFMLLHMAGGVTFTVLAAHSNWSARADVTLTKGTNVAGHVNTTHTVEVFFRAHPVAAWAVIFYIFALFHAVRACMRGSCCRCDDGTGKKIDPEGGAQTKEDSTTSVPFLGTQPASIEVRQWDRAIRFWCFSIVMPVVTVCIMLQAGVSDFYALIGGGGAAVAAGWLSLTSDMTAPGSETKRYRMQILLYSLVIGLVPWITIFWNLAITHNSGLSLPNTVYALIGFGFAFQFCFPIFELWYMSSFSTEMANKLRLVMRTKSSTPNTGAATRDNSEWAVNIVAAVYVIVLGSLTAANMLH